MADHDPSPGGVGVDLVAPRLVAAHLEALNLAGLGFATRRLLGRDPRPVTAQFTMWARQDHPGLPSVTAAFWQAVAPLGIGRPPGDDAKLCDRVLRGRAGDGAAALDAAAGCAEAGRVGFAAAPLPVLDGPDADRVTALVKAVKDYWRALGTVYGELRPRVVGGDRDRSARLLQRAQDAVRELVERIAVLATAVAAEAPAVAAAPPAAVRDDAAGELEVEPAPTGRLPRSPLGDLTQAEVRAAAFARAERVAAEPEPEPLPLEVLSTRPPRNRVFAPILFAVVVAGLALYVIFSVLNAPNPLAGQ
jgi:hypothetical protein